MVKAVDFFPISIICILDLSLIKYPSRIMVDSNFDKQIAHWSSGAEEALETAGILIEKRKYLFGFFFCHLAVEKLLKALFISVNKIYAPKTHDLEYLLLKSGLDPGFEKMEIVYLLMQYQMEGRYPEERQTVPSAEFAKEVLFKTKDLFEWLKKKL